jgi:hypothetical protein
MQQAESELITLKSLVKGAAAAMTDQDFEWWINSDGSECLQLGYVAATFRAGHRILFDRRPRGGSMSLFVGDSPVPAEEWQLEPRGAANSPVWAVRSASKRRGEFPSNQRAKEIVERLVRYHEDYTKACMPK